MPSRLSGCQETGAGVWAPDMAKSRQCTALMFPPLVHVSTQGPQILILVPSGPLMPLYSRSRKGLSLPTSGVLAFRGDSPVTQEGPQGTQARPPRLQPYRLGAAPSLSPSSASASRAEGCWEHGRGSACNPGNASQGDSAFGGLHGLMLSRLLSALPPTSEHGPSASAVCSRPVTAHVPLSFSSQRPPASAVLLPRVYFSRSYPDFQAQLESSLFPGPSPVPCWVKPSSGFPPHWLLCALKAPPRQVPNLN